MSVASEMAKYLKVWENDLPRDISSSVVHEKEMDVMKFQYRDVVAIVGCGYTTARGGDKRPWATVYRVEVVRDKQGARDAAHLLKALKKHYKKHGYDFAYSFAETAFIKHILWLSGLGVREESIE